ncbi:MAG: PQ-loop repeat-containing protein [Lachnospiraceae bacterium]|nr:PQ-loop repeat-containing protein [Lachnospiraceae bacterium]
MRELVYYIITVILTVANIASYLPQIVKLIKTKSSDDISLKSWILFDITYILYIVLAIMDEAGIGILLVSITEALSCIITTILIILFRKH